MTAPMIALTALPAACQSLVCHDAMAVPMAIPMEWGMVSMPMSMPRPGRVGSGGGREGWGTRVGGEGWHGGRRAEAL